MTVGVTGDESEEAEGCALHDIVRLLSRAHMLEVLYEFMRRGPGPHRFVDLQRSLGVPPNTLSERLRELVTARLVERMVFDDTPPRVEYRVTPLALELQPTFDSLRAFSLARPSEPAAEGGMP